jgi:hypothetical protein
VLAALSSRDLTELAAFYALEEEVQDEAMKAAELKAAAQRPVERRGHRMGG